MRYLSRSITGQASRANNDYAGATCEGDRGFLLSRMALQGAAVDSWLNAS